MFGQPSVFIGRVVNRDDPTKSGAVQVRAHGYHDDTTNIPDDDLPWAKSMMPTTSSSLGSVGSSPTGMQANSTVFGMFLDADHQNLVILGTLHGANSDTQSTSGGDSGSTSYDATKDHDVATNARGEGDDPYKDMISPKKEPDEFEPTKEAKPRYPYNKVTKTEGGHYFEVDDTPGAERYRFMHKDGSYFEYTNGQLVSKVNGAKYEVVQEGSTILVKGDAKINVAGNANTTVGGNMETTVSGNMKATVAGNMEMQAQGTGLIKAAGGLTVESPSTLTLKGSSIRMEQA